MSNENTPLWHKGYSVMASTRVDPVGLHAGDISMSTLVLTEGCGGLLLHIWSAIEDNNDPGLSVNGKIIHSLFSLVLEGPSFDVDDFDYPLGEGRFVRRVTRENLDVIEICIDGVRTYRTLPYCMESFLRLLVHHYDKDFPPSKNAEIS